MTKTRGVTLFFAFFALVGAYLPILGAQERIVPSSPAEVQLSYAPLVQAAVPAVVNIYTRRVVQVQRSPIFDDPFFRQFFGDQLGGIPEERVQGSLGSGVIVSKDGLIVTNNHVVGQADTISVVLADRREYEAEVILTDQRTDLAILKIDAGREDLPFMRLADSDDILVGDIVLAIGNPFGVGQTVTTGIVSATARTQTGISDFGFFIQTDAAINPGNSGGALVGMDGSLLGINSAIYSRSGASNGIGFAIPANMVASVLRAALNDGKIIRPWFGATGQSVDQSIAQSLGLARPGGVIINQIYPGGPADLAGVETGDVVLAVNGREVIDTGGLSFRVATAEVGQESDFLIYRNDRRMTLPVRLVRPPEEPARDITALDGRHVFQGVTVANLSPAYADELGIDTFLKGVIVLEVDRRSPAGRRQFVRPGDIITIFNNQPIGLVDDLEAVLAVEAEDYVYQLRRQGRDIECGIIQQRSFYCR